jgi:hypothetical protein
LLEKIELCYKKLACVGEKLTISWLHACTPHPEWLHQRDNISKLFCSVDWIVSWCANCLCDILYDLRCLLYNLWTGVLLDWWLSPDYWRKVEKSDWALDFISMEMKTNVEHSKYRGRKFP